MSIYFGDLHSHTGFSDGKLTPRDAFLMAYKAKNLDFLAVTDHAARIDPQKYQATIDAAQECTNNDFVAIAGCENGFDEKYYNEYGVPVINGGELITFNSDTTCCESNSLEDFTDKLYNEGKAFAGFAHPQEASWPTEFLWNGYDMKNHNFPKNIDFIKMIEVCNETSDYNLLHEKIYPTALDCGFRVSAIAVSDTHNSDWGMDNLLARTAVYATSLTRENIFHALKNQQCYATETGNTELSFKINDVFMGGELPQNSEYRFEVLLNEPRVDENEFEFSTLEVISDYGNCIHKVSILGYNISMEFTLKNYTARYFYLRIKNIAGKRIWSSPIFTHRKVDNPKALPQLTKLNKRNFKASKHDLKLFNNNPTDAWRCKAECQSGIIDLGGIIDITAVGYHRHLLPYCNLKEIHSLLNRYCYETSLDGIHFEAAATGIITNYGSEQIHIFEKRRARFVKITAISSIGFDSGLSGYFPVIGEISIYE